MFRKGFLPHVFSVEMPSVSRPFRLFWTLRVLKYVPATACSGKLRENGKNLSSMEKAIPHQFL
jgi:hypothetical protein